MRIHATSLPDDGKIWVITISFNGPEHIHMCLWMCALWLEEQRLFGRLCPLCDSSVGASVCLEWRNICDRVLACVSLSAASALYCLSPSVTSWPQGGQRSEKLHSLSLRLDKFWQIDFPTTQPPPPPLCSTQRLFLCHWQNSPTLNVTYFPPSKASLGGTDGSVPHELKSFICVVMQYDRQPNNEHHNIQQCTLKMSESISRKKSHKL